MPVKEADPAAKSLDAAFAEAMGAPAKPKEPAPPPETDPEAPHGRDDDGKPLAPFGLTKEGKPRRSTAGRKPKEDQARVSPAAGQPAAGEAKTGTVVAKKDYSGALGETADSLWVALTVLGQLPLDKIPLLGRIPAGKGATLGSRLAGAEVKLAAQAHILAAHKAPMVSALNLAAQNNARARRLAEKLETGDATWVLMCGALAAPVLVASRELWSGKLDTAALAEANRAEFEAWTAQLIEAMTAAAQQAGQELELATAAAQNGHAPQEPA